MKTDIEKKRNVHSVKKAKTTFGDGKNASFKSPLMMFCYLRKLVHVDFARPFIEESLWKNTNFETKNV